jgi:hypothetical protein
MFLGRSVRVTTRMSLDSTDLKLSGSKMDLKSLHQFRELWSEGDCMRGTFQGELLKETTLPVVGGLSSIR